MRPDPNKSAPSPNLQKFLDRTISVLKNDKRILGIAAAGSWITGMTDEYSDLDVLVVCDSTGHEAILAERTQIAESLGDFVAGFTGEHVGEPRLFICLYDNPVLHVDLKFVQLHDLEQRIENPVVVWERDGLLSKQMAQSQANHPMPELQWIEDRFWIWVHYAAAKIGRGELFETLDFLSYVRGVALGPLSLARHGALPRGTRRLETLAPKDVNDFRRMVATYDLASCIAATEAMIVLYRKIRDELDDGKLVRRSRAEQVSTDYLAKIKRQKSATPAQELP